MTADFEAERRVTITLSKLEADQIDVWRGRMNVGDREEAIQALLDFGLGGRPVDSFRGLALGVGCGRSEFPLMESRSE